MRLLKKTEVNPISSLFTPFALQLRRRKNYTTMKHYYRIMLGQKSIYAEEAYNGNYIGAGWLEDINLTNKLPDNWREFNKKYITYLPCAQRKRGAGTF